MGCPYTWVRKNIFGLETPKKGDTGAEGTEGDYAREEQSEKLGTYSDAYKRVRHLMTMKRGKLSETCFGQVLRGSEPCSKLRTKH